MASDELAVLQTIDSALSSLDDPQARIRVLQWVWSKFGNADAVSKPSVDAPKQMQVRPAQKPVMESIDGEIPGIAKLTENGELVLTVRDIKAINKNDAAVRLVHIIIRAYQILTNEKNVSSKNVVTPQLKLWRAYDGNTRRAISQHKGIIRNGDELTLDVHSTHEAEQYMEEVLDESVEGRWSPTNSSSRKKIRRKRQ